MEAAQAFSVPGLSAWYRESPIWRARMIAHEYYKSIREMYLHEEAMSKAKKEEKGKGGGNPLTAMKQRFGIG